MIVVVASAKGAPGVTTLAAALTATAPDDAVLVEADPAGGAVASWWGLSVEVGLAQVAAATGRNVRAATVLDACQPLAGGPGRVLAAPTSSRLCASMWALTSAPLAGVLSGLGPHTIIDVGRARPDSPVWPLVEAAEVGLVACRPRLPEVAQVADRVTELASAGPELRVVCVGNRPYAAAEVADFVGVEVAGILAEDPVGVAQFAPAGSRRVLSHSQWWRSVRSLTERLFTADTTAAATPADRREVEVAGG